MRDEDDGQGGATPSAARRTRRGDGHADPRSDGADERSARTTGFIPDCEGSVGQVPADHLVTTAGSAHTRRAAADRSTRRIPAVVGRAAGLHPIGAGTARGAR